MMYRSADWRKTTLSDEEEQSYNVGGTDDHYDPRRSKNPSWLRVKWTDEMVRLLITSMSYTVDNLTRDSIDGTKRKPYSSQKKGKWRSVSKVMAERGFRASPQQCEDKFNDMNKRYIRLNELLGKGTSCDVVENHALLDILNYLSEKEKDEVRKILNSKQLFYEEMCSFHNGNRLHLPHDPDLEHLLQVALRSREEHGDLDEDFPEVVANDYDECEEVQPLYCNERDVSGIPSGFAKRARTSQPSHDIFSHNLSAGKSGTPVSQPPIAASSKDHISSECARLSWPQKQIEYRTIKLKEQRLKLQLGMLEVERQCAEWRNFNQKKAHELEWMMIENERLKFENERMATKLKRKNMDFWEL